MIPLNSPTGDLTQHVCKPCNQGAFLANDPHVTMLGQLTPMQWPLVIGRLHIWGLRTGLGKRHHRVKCCPFCTQCILPIGYQATMCRDMLL